MTLTHVATIFHRVTTALDTHSFVKELQAAGFTDAQAEAVVSVATRSIVAMTGETATQRDVALAASDMKLAMATMETQLKVAISEQGKELQRWVIGVVGLQTLTLLGALIAILRYAIPR